MSENKEIEEAMNELEEMSKDEELRMVAELREKAIKDEKNGLRHARQEGIEEGIKQGIEQGMEKKIEEVTRRMLKLNIPIQDIINTTDLTEEEILKIKKSIK